MEQWKDIEGFEGYYQISNLGNVRSLDRYVIANKSGGIKLLKGKIMKLTRSKGREDTKSWYLVVNLRKCGKNKVCTVHRLVAEAFLPNPQQLPVINHIDGNKENNHVSNLEWSTHSNNNQHALDTGLRMSRGISIVQCNMNGDVVCEYKSASEAARVTQLDRGSICHCLRNRRPSYAGFIWKYKSIT